MASITFCQNRKATDRRGLTLMELLISLVLTGVPLVLISTAITGSPTLGLATALIRRLREVIWIAWGLVVFYLLKSAEAEEALRARRATDEF